MRLREHQVRAIAAIRAAAAAGERRMTVVAACGSGKTLIAQRAAQELAPRGSTLVLMPTLALLAQTARRWREAGLRGAVLGVCSLSQADSGLDPREARMTRRPEEIARTVLAGGLVTVFATYDSLKHLVTAHDEHGLPPWDLLIADEAHRTCAAFGEGWGAVHDDVLVPAKTRIYMTATPRIWSPVSDDPLRQRLRELDPSMERAPMATMEHREIFGPTVFELGMPEAIDRGILADYQVVIPVIHESDADLHAVLAARRPGTSAHHDGLRSAALEVSVLRAIAEYGLRRVLVFHNRVVLARDFAASLAVTARDVGPPLRIDDLWSRAIYGEQPTDERRDLLADFGTPERPYAVLSNVRVLNEGVDMPDVDGVYFAAPRYSIIDAIQAIGRGLRQPPGAGKKTTLVIPVYLPAGASLADALGDPAFGGLLALLQALRAHDASFMDRIALPARSQPSLGLEKEQIHYAQPERAAQLARALGLTIALPAIGSWTKALESAASYRAAFGHLDVPVGYVHAGFALGECLANIRLRYLMERLPADRKKEFDRLGMRWTASTSHFASMLELARTWAARRGHLTMPVNEDLGGHPVGKWLATQRRKANTGKLPAAYQQSLTDIDPHWNPPWPQDWQRRYAEARAEVATHGLDTVLHYHYERSMGDRSPWRAREYRDWLSRQQASFFDLHEGQQDLLLALGVPPLPDSVFPYSAQGDTPDPFYLLLQSAGVFLVREGHLDVPDRHREPQWGISGRGRAFALGPRLREARVRFDFSGEERQRALQAFEDLAERVSRARRFRRRR